MMLALAANVSDDWKIELLRAAKSLFSSLSSLAPNNRMWGWILGILIIVVGLGMVSFLVLGALAHAFEAAAKLLEAYKNSGMPSIGRRQASTVIRKRKQFCDVLLADLAYIAKAENWNDQFFTDLEADVEIEGGYYASALKRLLKRRSFGIRRVSSLMAALESTSEISTLLVGEPGSGKSVALRHLARQLAERGRRSSDPKARIPLYINLRELPSPESLSDVTADYIRQFVLDNIRRGDADTSAYVRDNWDKHRDIGVWYFLFDSFDEISDVLHAETGSHIIFRYAEAIREFLDGMGNCRGILASREFKGPSALPWHKFRVLPLNWDRQEELVRNAFLEPGQTALVRQHLASTQSGLGANPMFLSLLCRYIKSENRLPAADYELLSMHIDRLAARDADYIIRKYGINSSALLIGAERLASLFAENTDLSLSPTMDQITTALGNETDKLNLETLIAALVDVKIGRSDVPEARPGDRRFAFSHRRYQETLFVRYLRNAPDAISDEELLRNSRWRDYVVTLLQTSPYTDVLRILKVARRLLHESAKTQSICPIAVEFAGLVPVGTGYFTWSEDDVPIHILSMTQEGLARRLTDVPADFSMAVLEFLQPRWENGDDVDRANVIATGGLLPQNILIQYFSHALISGNGPIVGFAFEQSIYLIDPPPEIAKQIHTTLGGKLLEAKRSSELARLEAWAARLPPAMGAKRVLERYNTYALLIGPFKLFARLSGEPLRQAAKRVFPAFMDGFSTVLYFQAIITVGVTTLLRISKLQYLAIALGIGSISFIGIVIALYWNLSAGRRRIMALTMVFVFSLAALIGFLLDAALKSHARALFLRIFLGTVILLILFPFLLILFLLLDSIRDWRHGRMALSRLRLLEKHSLSDLALSLASNSPSELSIWLERRPTMLCNLQDIRSMFTLLIALERRRGTSKADSGPLCNSIIRGSSTVDLKWWLRSRLRKGHSEEV
jgi:hypothetical protein